MRVEQPAGDLVVPLVRQRDRLARCLAELDDEGWATPSRCDGWTVRDVVFHLMTTNGFWAFSVSMGRAGDPTRVLDGFDPVATPAQMVAADGQGPAELLAAFVASNHALADSLSDLDDDDSCAVGAGAS